jgi:hypothetical protein
MLLLVFAEAGHSWIVRGLLRLPLRYSGDAIVLPGSSANPQSRNSECRAALKGWCVDYRGQPTSGLNPVGTRPYNSDDALFAIAELWDTCIRQHLRTPPHQRGSYSGAQLLWRLGWPFGGPAFTVAGSAALVAVSPRREPRELLGCQVPCFGIDPFGRRTVKSDALLMGKYGLAIGRRHFPAGQHAERVWNRPVHRRGNLTGRADREGANVFS